MYFRVVVLQIVNYYHYSLAAAMMNEVVPAAVIAVAIIGSLVIVTVFYCYNFYECKHHTHPSHENDTIRVIRKAVEATDNGRREAAVAIAVNAVECSLGAYGDGACCNALFAGQVRFRSLWVSDKEVNEKIKRNITGEGLYCLVYCSCYRYYYYRYHGYSYSYY